MLEDLSHNWQCPLDDCRRLFGQRKSLVRHVRCDHPAVAMSCRFCRQRLDTEAHRLYHRRHCFRGANAIKCNDCGASFTMLLSFRRHVRGHALNECGECGERLSSRKQLVKHLRELHHVVESEKWYPCSQCARRFMKKRSLLQHQKVHATPAEVQCNRCHVIVPRSQLSQHMNTAHASTNASSELHCSLCDRWFLRNQQYQQHLQLHKKYTCHVCTVSFVARAEYLSHISHAHIGHDGAPSDCSTDSSVMPPPWTQCEELGPTAQYQVETCVQHSPTRQAPHIPVPTTPCPNTHPSLLCQHCGAQFRRAATLRRHVAREHASVASQSSTADTVLPNGSSLVCCHCGHKSSSRSNLQRHMAAHWRALRPAQKRPFVCDKCAAGFHTLSSLNDHQRYVHSSERLHKCAECSKQFKTSTALNRHTRCHSARRPYQCHCGNSYKRGCHLRRHMENIHGQRIRSRRVQSLMAGESLVRGDQDVVSSRSEDVETVTPSTQNHTVFTPGDSLVIHEHCRSWTISTPTANSSVPEQHARDQQCISHASLAKQYTTSSQSSTEQCDATLSCADISQSIAVSCSVLEVSSSAQQQHQEPTNTQQEPPPLTACQSSIYFQLEDVDAVELERHSSMTHNAAVNLDDRGAEMVVLGCFDCAEASGDRVPVEQCNADGESVSHDAQLVSLVLSSTSCIDDARQEQSCTHVLRQECLPPPSSIRSQH